MAVSLSLEALTAYRRHTFKLDPDHWLRSADEAVDFVNRRGFVFFWPIKDMLLPSLWNATVGDRPVPNNHDDPGHVTWGWKDQLLGQRRWYYGRILRKRNAILSLHLLPSFYALSPNYGDPESDFLDQYQQGLLSMEARNIYALLLKSGPLDSLTIRRETGLSATSANAAFNRALDTLQMEFKILPVSISQAGRWHYAFEYDLVTHHFPNLQQEARPISVPQAQQNILHTYLLSVGAAELTQAARLFGWKPAVCQQAANALAQHGLVLNDVQITGQTGNWIAAKDILP
jgi:hypothetical protein